jgi:hypothetical protein
MVEAHHQPEARRSLLYVGINSNVDASVSLNATIPFNILTTTFSVNKGSHFNTSNHRFTAPVAGLYRFISAVYLTNSAGAAGVMQLSFQVNGSYVITGQDSLGSGHLIIGSSAGQMTSGTAIAELINVARLAQLKYGIEQPASQNTSGM